MISTGCCYSEFCPLVLFDENPNKYVNCLFFKFFVDRTISVFSRLISFAVDRYSIDITVSLFLRTSVGIQMSLHTLKISIDYFISFKNDQCVPKCNNVLNCFYNKKGRLFYIPRLASTKLTEYLILEK